ncbi:MAG: KEOPS complex subunit Pcc1 [Candidatus Micrarchaeia archaeon]
MSYKCTIEITPADPEAVARALSTGESYDRSSITVDVEGEKVFIRIIAKDITALRAAVNDYLRLARVCESLPGADS